MGVRGFEFFSYENLVILLELGLGWNEVEWYGEWSFQFEMDYFGLDNKQLSSDCDRLEKEDFFLNFLDNFLGMFDSF